MRVEACTKWLFFRWISDRAIWGMRTFHAKCGGFRVTPRLQQGLAAIEISRGLFNRKPLIF